MLDIVLGKMHKTHIELLEYRLQIRNENGLPKVMFQIIAGILLGWDAYQPPWYFFET